jgi:GTP cyclohydrolase II
MRLWSPVARSGRADRRRRRLPAVSAPGGAWQLDAYGLQDAGLDTYEANVALGHREDERSYLVAAQMLEALDEPRVALLSNNPDKARQLARFGVTVTARVKTDVHLSAANARYLATKAGRGAHTLDVSRSAG